MRIHFPKRPIAPAWLLLLLFLGLLLAFPLAIAQYRQALPGYQFQFPRDHANHPDYKTEWWYYTGHLEAADGRRFGYELTFFRVGTDMASEARNDHTPWNPETVYAAHFALSDLQGRRFHFSEKLNRAGIGVAGARSDQYLTWNELWSAKLLGNHHVLAAHNAEQTREIHLLLTPEKPPVIHGSGGVSQKADCVGCASHYYSLTRLQTDGFLILDGQAVPVTGLSWMDHEFGSNQLTAEQTGWDWFSIQLADRSELMLYLLRRADGSLDPNSSGTVVDADGRSRHLTLRDFTVAPTGRTWTSPETGGRYPVGWRITVPSEQMALTVTPYFDQQELVTTGSTGVAYWEGASAVQGTHKGQPIGGQAYVELTGYAAPFRQRI